MRSTVLPRCADPAPGARAVLLRSDAAGALRDAALRGAGAGRRLRRRRRLSRGCRPRCTSRAAASTSCCSSNRVLGWGASGRNGGQVHVGMRRDQHWLEAHVGAADARRFWDLRARGAPPPRLADRDLRDRLRLCGSATCTRTTSARYTEHTRRHVECCAAAYGYEHLRYVERDETREHRRDARLSTAVRFDARGGHLHALNFALGIARAAQATARGCTSRSRSPGSQRHSGGWRVATRHGERAGRTRRARLQRLPAPARAVGRAPRDADQQLHRGDRAARRGGRASPDQQRLRGLRLALRRQLLPHDARPPPAVRRRRELQLPLSA